eukprot:9049030-Pyramimonas_sp.AAC.1
MICVPSSSEDEAPGSTSFFGSCRPCGERRRVCLDAKNPRGRGQPDTEWRFGLEPAVRKVDVTHGYRPIP